MASVLCKKLFAVLAIMGTVEPRQHATELWDCTALWKVSRDGIIIL